MKPLMRYAMMRTGDERREDQTESRFRDRTGREHYDNGRFAPMRSAYDDGGMERRNYPRMADVDREPPRMGYGMPYMGMTEPMRGTYDRPSMGYGEPARMNYPEPVRMGDDEDYRRKWTITENNGDSPQYRGERNPDGMTRIYGFGGGSRVEHPQYDEMERRTGHKQQGYASGRGMPVLTAAMAEEWMQNLHNEDGSHGPHWSMDDVKRLMQQKGLQADPMRLWVAMNAEYSDMVTVARKHGVDKPEYYLDSAMARWLNDKDAVEDKEAAYFMYVVKH